MDWFHAIVSTCVGVHMHNGGGAQVGSLLLKLRGGISMRTHVETYDNSCGSDSAGFWSVGAST